MGCGSSAPEQVHQPSAPSSGNIEPQLPPVTVAEKTQSHPKVSAGWIMKEGQNFKSWKRRFFILKDGTLTYFEKETVKGSNVGEVKLGELVLKGYKVTRPSPDQMLLSNATDESARKLLLECSDEACQKAWINAFNEHIDFLAIEKKAE